MKEEGRDPVSRAETGDALTHGHDLARAVREGHDRPRLFGIVGPDDQEQIAVMRSKNQRFNPLRDTKAFTRTFVKVLNIAGLPVMFVLFGVYVWVRRKTRRRTIQVMFVGEKTESGVET